MEPDLRFIEKSMIESENIAVFDLIKFIIKEKRIIVPEISIYKIKEERGNTPDFYTLGFCSVIEIKQITENTKEMSIVGSTKNNVLDQIAKEILPKITHKNRNYYVSIIDNIPLKSRGLEYKKIINSITESINLDLPNGKTSDFYYRIFFNETPQKQSYLQIGFGGSRNPNSDSLSKSILPLLEKAKIQLAQFTSNQNKFFSRILLLDHLYTFTPLTETVTAAIYKAFATKENSYWSIDSIYLRIFGNIIKIN